MAPPDPARGRRLETVDGARGAAMLAVFLAHFCGAYEEVLSASRFRSIGLVTRIASPAFIWLSGMMLGLLHERNREAFAPVRDRLIDRALVLLLVGHPLITVAIQLRSHAFAVAFERLFITDTIAVCVILGALLVPRLRPGVRALAGAILLCVTWALMLLWAPQAGS